MKFTDENTLVNLAVIADLFEDEETLNAALQLFEPNIVELPCGIWQLTVAEAKELCKLALMSKAVDEVISARLLISDMSQREYDLEKTLTAAEDLIKRQSTKIEGLETTIENSDVEIDELNTELGWSNETKDEWECQANDLENEIFDKEQIISDQQEEIDDMEMQIHELENKITELEEDVEYYKDADYNGR